MSELYDAIMAANAAYAATFTPYAPPDVPRQRLAVLTCMDARLDPLRFMGLTLGDAYVIRNAGGRASDDAIRSLVISYKLLGTQEWFVIHHTCGMQTFTNEIMADVLSRSLKTASVDANGWHDTGDGPGSPEGAYINWLTIRDQAQSVVEDVTRIRNHPLVPRDIPIVGLIFDVASGALLDVPDATAIGAAS